MLSQQESGWEKIGERDGCEHWSYQGNGYIEIPKGIIASLTEAHKVEMEKAQKEIDHLSIFAQHDIRCITQFEEDEKCDCGLLEYYENIKK
jgi:hypothetical protein